VVDDFTTATFEELERNRWVFYVATETRADRKGGNEWRWRCSDVNGNVLFISSEGYTNLEDAKQCARRAGWDERKTTEGLPA
jgi:hypothetical protein